MAEAFQTPTELAAAVALLNAQQSLQSDALYALAQQRQADAERLINALNPAKFVFTPPPVLSPPVRYLLVMDVSSNNGMDIGALLDRYKPDACIIKAYQSIELGGHGSAFTVAQTRACVERGIPTAYYPWLYAGIDGGHQVDDAMRSVKLADGQGAPVLLDCETYTDGSSPTRAVVMAAKAAALNAAPIVAGYTGLWWIDGYYQGGQTGWAQDMGDVWQWLSQYDGIRTLDSTRMPGGVPLERLGGKQFQGNPVDLSLFRSDALGL